MNTATTMPAYRILRAGEQPSLVEMDIPTPGVGEVLIEIGGAGLCRTDLELIDDTEAVLGMRPITLGHENAGWVVAVGPGVEYTEVGQAVVLSPIVSCGNCANCRADRTNYCFRARARGIALDGGLAGYMVAAERELVVLNTMSPSDAAPLADAGLSAFAAVSAAVRSAPSGTPIVIIGVGGLGSFAVQFARELSGTRIIAVDGDPQRLERAGELGASHLICTDGSSVQQVRALVGPEGAGAVIDFVGTDLTLAGAAQAVGAGGAIVLCGRGGGTLPFNIESIRPGVSVVKTSGGTVAQLAEVVKYAEQGRITCEIEKFVPDQIGTAYEQLRAGLLRGRAVVTFSQR